MPLLFQPWKPADDDPRLEGVRLLVLGESHYEERQAGIVSGSPELPDFTRWVVQTWGISPTRRQVFFANLHAVLTGEPWSLNADHSKVWRHVFYYNYIQSLVVGGARNAPTSAQFEASADAFRTVLDEIRPEAILVMGQRLWNGMTPEDGWVQDAPATLGRVCLYRLSHGDTAFAMPINHPSSFGFSPSRWHERVLTFLQWRRQVQSS